MERRRGWSAIVLACSVAVVAAGCGSSSKSGAGATTTTPPAGSSGSGAATASSYPPIPPGPITVCLSASLSGADATVSSPTAKEQHAMIDTLNTVYGGIAGHPVKIDIENDETDATIAANIATKFVSEHCAAVVGLTYNPAATPEQAAVLNKGKVLVFTGSEINDFYNPKLYPYIFSLSPSHFQIGQVVAHFLITHHLTKIGELTNGVPEMTEYFNDVITAGKQMGGNLTVVKSVSIAPGAVEMQTQLTELRQANPDVVLTAIEFGFGPVWQTMHTIGWSPTIVGDQGFFYSGYSALGSLGPNSYSPCWLGLRPGSSVPQSVINVINEVGPDLAGAPSALITASDGMGALFMLKMAVEATHTLDTAALVNYLQTFNSTPVWWSGNTYTYNSTRHVGLVGPYTVGMCQGAPLGKIGNNVPNFVYTSDSYRPPVPTS